jgi:hypothetical protein
MYRFWNKVHFPNYLLLFAEIWSWTDQIANWRPTKKIRTYLTPTWSQSYNFWINNVNANVVHRWQKPVFQPRRHGLSCGIVSAWHWSCGSRDRIPPGYRVLAFKREKRYWKAHTARKFARSNPTRVYIGWKLFKLKKNQFLQIFDLGRNWRRVFGRFDLWPEVSRGSQRPQSATSAKRPKKGQGGLHPR